MNKIKNIYVEGIRRTWRYLVFTILFQISGLPALLIVFLLFKTFGYSICATVSFSEDPMFCSILILFSILYLPFAIYFVCEISKQFKKPLFLPDDNNESTKT